jgi:hypothetical protein
MREYDAASYPRITGSLQCDYEGVKIGILFNCSD